MIIELTELLHREVAALELVEGRLRSLELLEAAGEQRFVTSALDDLERAAERLAALELGRAMALVGAGLPADVTAADVLALTEDPTEREALARAVDRLRVATTRVADSRDRVRVIVGDGAERTGARLALAAHT